MLTKVNNILVPNDLDEAIFKKKVYLDSEQLLKVFDSMEDTLQAGNLVFHKFVKKSDKLITLSYLNDKISKVPNGYVAVVAMIDFESNGKYFKADSLLVRKLINKGSGNYNKTAEKLTRSVKKIDFTDGFSIYQLFDDVLNEFVEKVKLSSEVGSKSDEVAKNSVTKDEFNAFFNKLPKTISIRKNKFVKIINKQSGLKIGYECDSLQLDNNQSDIRIKAEAYLIGLTALIEVKVINDRVIPDDKVQLQFFTTGIEKDDKKNRRPFSDEYELPLRPKSLGDFFTEMVEIIASTLDLKLTDALYDLDKKDVFESITTSSLDIFNLLEE